MTNVEQHYRIIPYVKTPAIDLGGGTLVSEKCLAMRDYHMSCLRENSVRTFCIDGIPEEDPNKILMLWAFLSEGGCLISANPIPTESFKELRKASFMRKSCYQILETEPFTVLRKVHGNGGEVPYTKPKPKPGQKTVCLVRYGALGDHVMMSVIIDHFHKEGWYVVYNTNQRGRNVYRGDPRIDEYIDHEDDIIPPNMEKLNAYWGKWEKHFDRFINFGGIAEMDLLRVEGIQPEYLDPWVKRHDECNKNYYDHHFERAGLPEIKGRRPVMWLSEQERQWARKEVDDVRKKLGKNFIVIWNMLGSAFHKMYPWTYDVWYTCLHNRDDIGFITVSDHVGAYMEEKMFGNVYPRSGKYQIRHTIALHSSVDGVVSPETNSLNTGLAFPAPIIALLSHSSKDQFPWREYDIPLSPPVKDCKCYPCHQLHYSRLGCHSGVINKAATLCMDQINPTEVYHALLRIRYGDNALAASR